MVLCWLLQVGEVVAAAQEIVATVMVEVHPVAHWVDQDWPDKTVKTNPPMLMVVAVVLEVATVATVALLILETLVPMQGTLEPVMEPIPVDNLLAVVHLDRPVEVALLRSQAPPARHKSSLTSRVYLYTTELLLSRPTNNGSM
jgi:hypothetical protein